MSVTETELGEWIEQARVTYELGQHVVMNADAVARIGFDVILRANRSADCTGDPTCDACDRTMKNLLAVAGAAIPPDALREAEPDDHSFHLRPETGFAMELQVTVTVFYGSGTFEEAGKEDATLSLRVTGALEAMGVQPRLFRA